MARPTDTAKIHRRWLKLYNDIRHPLWLLELGELGHDRRTIREEKHDPEPMFMG